MELLRGWIHFAPWFLAFGVLFDLVQRRWGWRGFVIALCVGLVAPMAVGTVMWMRPHAFTGTITTRWQDWQCMSTDYAPALLSCAAAAWLGIRTVKSSTAWRRTLAVLLWEAVIVVPAAFLTLWWGVQILSCDVL
jgi:hypothetical protein